jgi:hypothetical protein
MSDSGLDDWIALRRVHDGGWRSWRVPTPITTHAQASGWGVRTGLSGRGLVRAAGGSRSGSYGRRA